MKVLWLTVDFRTVHGPFRHYYLSLEESFEKIADVVFYGRKESEMDVVGIAKETQPDVIMVYLRRQELTKKDWQNLDKINIPKALRCCDPWDNMERHIEWIKKNKINLVFLLHGAAKEDYQKRLKVKVVPLFQSLSSHLFKNRHIERIYDVFLTGNFGPKCYPLRHAIYQAYGQNPRCWIRPGHHSLPTVEDYIQKLNQSKILATGNCCCPMFGRTDLKFFQVKPLEAMATGTLAMMDVPTCAEELHLIPDYNFVAINTSNFKEKIQYYLENEEEREAIAEHGYEVFTKYHTSDVRAQQVKKQLEALVEENE